MRLGLVTEGCACEEGAHYTGARARRLHVAHLAEERQGPRGLNRFLSAPQPPAKKHPKRPRAPLCIRPGAYTFRDEACKTNIFCGGWNLQPEGVVPFLEIAQLSVFQQLADPGSE